MIPIYCKAQITGICFCRLGKEFEGVTECLENTVCNETEIDAKRSLWNYDREKCVYHPTTDGQGGQGGANTAQSDRVVKCWHRNTDSGLPFGKPFDPPLPYEKNKSREYYGRTPDIRGGFQYREILALTQRQVPVYGDRASQAYCFTIAKVQSSLPVG